MQNTARARDACTKDHLELVDHSTFAAKDLRATPLLRLTLACLSLPAGHMSGDREPETPAPEQVARLV
jgi:hypothetical protein